MFKLIFIFVLAGSASLLRFGKRGFGPMDFMMGEHSLVPDVSKLARLITKIALSIVRKHSDSSLLCPCPSTSFRFWKNAVITWTYFSRSQWCTQNVINWIPFLLGMLINKYNSFSYQINIKNIRKFYFESQNAAIRAACPGLNVLVFVKGSGRAMIVAI